MSTPRVLFVCVRNGGKSQMAAGLLRHAAGETVNVDSAGTNPGTTINTLSAQSLHEVGVDITTETPKAITHELATAADLIVVLGREAHIEPVNGTRIEYWDTDEPSTRGIEGLDRMRLIRDNITARIDTLRTTTITP